MKTFITHKFIDNEEYEGEKIQAESFEEAEIKAKELGLIVDGHLEE
jgi:hypothetical protein